MSIGTELPPAEEVIRAAEEIIAQAQPETSHGQGPPPPPLPPDDHDYRRRPEGDGWNWKNSAGVVVAIIGGIGFFKLNNPTAEFFSYMVALGGIAIASTTFKRKDT